MQNSLSIFISIVFIFGCTTAKAQVFGGNPSRLKWEQINTDTADIIFPKGMERTGERVADIVHYMNEIPHPSIGNKVSKIHIILQNQPMIGNGYVGLGPFRSEYYLSPSPVTLEEEGGGNWTDLLTLHEYRHVLQYSNYNKGVVKVFRILFGQQGEDLAMNALIPDWLFEGDAVFNETALSNNGRGRTPSFYNGFKSLYLEQQKYSYLKIRNGSYKDYVPDHYHLGYLLTAYGREKYGADFWKKVSNDAIHLKGLFYPFSASLKRRSGYRINGFYKQAMQYYHQRWKRQSDTTQITAAEPLIHHYPKTVTDYQYPYYINHDNIIALKSSYQKIPAFYIIDSAGEEKRLLAAGITYDDYYSFNNNKIVWAQQRPDMRWGLRDNSIIRYYDINNKRNRIIAKGRYYSPDISHDGSRIIALQEDFDQQYHLLLMNNNGKLIDSLANPHNWYYLFPKFSLDDQNILSVVRDQQGRMALIRQKLSDGQSEILIPFTYKEIGKISETPAYLFFRASFDNKDEIFAYQKSDHQIYKAAASILGIYQPAANYSSKQLVFSRFTTEGYHLEQKNYDSSGWKRINNIAGSNMTTTPAATAVEGGNILKQIPGRKFTITNYSKAAHLFNFHSWKPFANPPDYGLELLSDNMLNTLSTSLQYTYNRNEGYSEISANLLYGGWYPVIGLSAGETLNRNAYTSVGEKAYWNEFSSNLQAYIPWNFSAGLYARYLSFGSSLHYSKVNFDPANKTKYKNYEIYYIKPFIQFENSRIKAYQNLYSHFAQNISLSYSKSLNQYYSERISASGDFYFPGIFPNHNLVLQTDYQQQGNVRQYAFSDDFRYARGYTSVPHSDIYRLSGSYHLPLLYPDIGFAKIIYLLRMRGAIFYDYSHADYENNGNQYHWQFRSTGAELFFDTNLWNEYPISVGIRYSQLLNKDIEYPKRTHFWEVIVPLQLF